ncbi:MAG: protein kinase [Verrucomicrobium sp.]
MSQNRYEVLGKIADGGLGSVFKAYDRNLRREVALKRVRAESPEEADRQAEQLFEEARTLSTLQHPHIVTIFDVGKDEEGAYIVMELLKGETLEDIIERGALNEGDFRQLVSQSLEGMIAAHATGLIHLDIKPQNFMVIWLPSGKFQIKILDFGLSKIAHQPMVQETDAEGAILGSIYFMAPEQFERSPVDVRTDLYSLGCVFYFALTQQYPFQGDTAPEVMASHLYHSTIPLAQMRPDLPVDLCRWVEWLMSRQPDHRPASMDNAFEWFQAGQAPLTPEEEAAIARRPPPPDLMTAPPPAPALGGTATQALRRAAPKFTRPGGSITQALGQRPVPKPTVKPVTIAAAAAPKHLQHKKALPKWLTKGVPLTLVGLAVAGVGFHFIQRSMSEGRFETLAQMAKPTGSYKDVNLLLGYLEDPRNSDAAAAVLLKFEDSEGNNKLISQYVPRAKEPWARRNIANVVGGRNIADAVEPIVRQLERARETDVRIASWNALGKIASPSEVPFMVEQVAGNDIDELRAAETAVVNAARKEPDTERRSLPVLQAYRANSGTDDVQAALLRTLGRLGGNNALDDITKALDNGSVKLRTAAALAFGDWPTAEPVAALETFIGKEKDALVRTNAINSLGSLAPLSGDVPQDEIATVLTKAFDATRDGREQAAILGALARVADPVAIAFFRDLANKEPRRKPVADSAIRTINQSLDRVTTITDATTVLVADKAELPPGPLTVDGGAIINWINVGDQVNWLVKLDQPGEYEVQINQAFDKANQGRYRLTIGKESFLRLVEKTGGGEAYKSVTVGRAKFSKPGHYRICIRPQHIAPGEYLMRLKDGSVTRLGG